MKYAVTDVSIYGAATVNYPNALAAEAAMALRRSDPMTLYAQLVTEGKITEQYSKIVAKRCAIVHPLEGNTDGV